ncbi:hypothetical protein PTKIN_Ptkin17bG0117500 [Pterospermum kingtungense]
MGKTLGIKRLHASKTQQKSLAAVPPWVIVMFNTMFFRNCVSHPDAKKNELDRFCIDCLQSFCSHCFSAHAIHKHVKIRRYIYSDVINRQDLCKLFNCSGIQVLDIYGDHEQRSEETRNIHRRSKLLRCLKDDDEEAFVGLPLTKKPRLRQTRKGVPLRAPMF